jgi:peptide/nickel transport system ATP-binding protein
LPGSEEILTTSSLLEIRNLRTYFHTIDGCVKAVDGINLEVAKAEKVGLVGESGSGKSTVGLSIMRLIPELARVEDGQILFEGKDMAKLDENEMRALRGKEMSLVFQDPSTYLNPVMKIEDQLFDAFHSQRREKVEELRRKVHEALRAVLIPAPEKIAKAYPHQLSSGMKQRIVIAIAFLNKPKLIIADEPTTALDVTVQAEILELLRKLTVEQDTSLLLISHDIGIVAELCDRVYVMYAGKIVENGDVFSLFKNPKHPYTRGLLRSALTVHKLQRELVGIEGFVPDLINPPRGCRFHPRCACSKPICFEREPPTVTDEPGHVVSCWLYS